MGGRNPPRFFALQNFGESKMTKTQRQALRELKQRNKYRQRCERESERHMRRMLAMKSPALSRVAVAWISCFFICASCAIIFGGALVFMVVS
tara:strand:- start:108 stop:383 length:276 start_codon:yes stop_codon:yes gene_type:complete